MRAEHIQPLLIRHHPECEYQVSDQVLEKFEELVEKRDVESLEAELDGFSKGSSADLMENLINHLWDVNHDAYQMAQEDTFCDLFAGEGKIRLIIEKGYGRVQNGGKAVPLTEEENLRAAQKKASVRKEYQQVFDVLTKYVNQNSKQKPF